MLFSISHFIKELKSILIERDIFLYYKLEQVVPQHFSIFLQVKISTMKVIARVLSLERIRHYDTPQKKILTEIKFQCQVCTTSTFMQIIKKW